MGDRRALLVPWPAPEAPHRIVEVIAAADAHGVLAVLAYSPDDDGLAVPELGLTLSRDATVVKRGIPRVAPGDPIPCPAPIVLGVFGPVAAHGAGRSCVGAGVGRSISSSAGPKPALLPSSCAQLAMPRTGTEAFAVLRSETEQVRKLVG